MLMNFSVWSPRTSVSPSLSTMSRLGTRAAGAVPARNASDLFDHLPVFFDRSHPRARIPESVAAPPK